jgi:hypothetical protein
VAAEKSPDRMNKPKTAWAGDWGTNVGFYIKKQGIAADSIPYC